MHTVDVIRIAAPPERVWPLAVQVERWPEILPHYRAVSRLAGTPEHDGTVAMSAWRPFGGPLNWPTWWHASMQVDHARHEIRYQHIAGITTGMDVLWTLTGEANATVITLLHDWRGPRWPLIGPLAANLVIGPVFIHGIASRTLAGIARAATAAA